MRNYLDNLPTPSTGFLWRCTLLCLCLFCALPASIPAQAFAWSNDFAQAGGVEITFGLAEQQTAESGVTVGDVLLLALEIRHPDGSQVAIPILPVEWGTFEVRTQSTPETGILPDGDLLTRQVISVALFAPGEHTTPPFSISFQADDGSISDYAVPTLTLSVQPVLQEDDPGLRDIRPQAHLPSPFPWGWAFGLLAAIGGGLVFWQRLRKRSARDQTALPAPLPAHLAALEELERIAALGLPRQGAFKAYYSLLDRCLRRYLEDAFNLRALERTTAELRMELQHIHLASGAAQRLLEIFEQSDRVKFARYTPSVSAAEADLQNAVDLVRQAQPAPEAPSEGQAIP